ncbi:hypothetical protein [Rothia dentocariosa]|uniref:hypothetical protein n=1 Tax=Rothia dentocariosa TaxID=2047 RepID=UPI003A87186A
MHPTTNTHTNYTIIGTLLALIAGIILGHTLTLSTTLALTPNNPTTQGTQAVIHSYTDTAKHQTNEFVEKASATVQKQIQALPTPGTIHLNIESGPSITCLTMPSNETPAICVIDPPPSLGENLQP